MIPARVSFVTLGVQNFDEMRSFYGRLGWKEALSAENFVAFAMGGAILGLFPTDDLRTDAGGSKLVGKNESTNITFAINVEAPELVDEVITEAESAGATVVKHAETADWGGRSGYFADPEGNLWEVAHMPGSSFSDSDGLVLPSQ
jgi:catechol 2,3-dioxygenase-like lactoylglutathione lyase family enzyme